MILRNYNGVREGVFVIDCMGLHGTAWNYMELHGTERDCMARDCMRLHEDDLLSLAEPNPVRPWPHCYIG